MKNMRKYTPVGRREAQHSTGHKAFDKLVEASVEQELVEAVGEDIGGGGGQL
jgi:ribosomal protein L20A (L18A)